MTDSEILKEIISFIDSKENNAITINGEWGIGKTYLLKEKLRKIINNKYNEEYNYIYITPENLLNSSIREICYYDYIQKLKDNKSKFYFFQKIFNKNSKYLREISKSDKVSGSIFSFFNVVNNGLLKNQIKKHDLNNTFIIIDEIERKPDSLNLKDILNQIFTIKEDFKKVKIITSLNKEGLKVESEEEYDIFNNWLDKISNKDYSFKKSNHFDIELKKLNNEIKKILCFDIKLFDIFENIKSNKNKYNLRELNKFKDEIISIVKLIKDFRIENFQYQENKIISFFYIFTQYYYSNKEIEKQFTLENQNYLNFIKSFYTSYNKKELLKEELIKLNFYIDIDKNKKEEYLFKKNIFDNEYGSFFKNWNLETNPFEYFENLMMDYPEFFSFSDYVNSAFQQIEHLCKLFNKNSKQLEEITIKFLDVKYNQLLKHFIKLSEYENIYHREKYYNYLINELNNAIKILNSKNFNKKKILKKYKKLLKNKKSYKYITKYVFKDNKNILVYLSNDKKYSSLNSILKESTNDVNFLFYLINILEELRKEETIPSNYHLQDYQNFGNFFVNMLRMLKNYFDSKFHYIIDVYINKNNKFNLNLDYFCNTASIL